MKTLSISLLTFLLFAVIALGWLADILFDQFFTDEQETPMSYYQTLGQQLAHTIDLETDSAQFISNWQQADQPNHLSILTQEQLPIPEAMWAEVKRGEALILESNLGITFYYWLPTQQQLLAFSPQEFNQVDDRSSIPFILTTGYYLLLLGLLLVWLIPLLNSLRALRKNAIAYGKGDFSARIKKSRLTYIEDIEQSVNDMADQIETLINDNKLISSAVSHDLRTPLARLRFGIDILSDTDDIEEREKYQEHLSNDIDEMQSLVEALLNYARLDQTLISLEKTPINVHELLLTFQKNHPDNVVELEHHALKNASVDGHPTYLKMLLHNILNNALKYGDNAILVSTGESKNNLIISVHDDGGGIPEDARENLFKPFVRGEQLDAGEGYGMGLAIAKRIAQWHGGNIEIFDSNRLKGAEFLIRLPLSKAH